MAKYNGVKGFNGHKNCNAWNVSLWINNDEGLYNLAKDCVRSQGTREMAAETFLGVLNDSNITHTPDGVPYTITNIRLAMVGM